MVFFGVFFFTFFVKVFCVFLQYVYEYKYRLRLIFLPHVCISIFFNAHKQVYYFSQYVGFLFRLCCWASYLQRTMRMWKLTRAQRIAMPQCSNTVNVQTTPPSWSATGRDGWGFTYPWQSRTRVPGTRAFLCSTRSCKLLQLNVLSLNQIMRFWYIFCTDRILKKNVPRYVLKIDIISRR